MSGKTLPRKRFPTASPPAGARACALGVEARANQRGGAKTYLFGYGCGMVAAATPHGDVALALHTQPFNRQAITHFRPLSAAVTAVRGAPPINLAADAAFDAWCVYAACLETGGIAAIAPHRRGPVPPRSPEGHPLCARGFARRPTTTGRHEDGYRIPRYGCPLRGTATPCDDPRFARGGGTKRRNIEPGGLMRATIDRTGSAYRAVSRQRTAVERIYSQAQALGLERPNVRTLAAVSRLARLTAVTINLRLIARACPYPPPPT